jgi:hypothetical protein
LNEVYMMPLVQASVTAGFGPGPESGPNRVIGERERPRRELLEDNRRLAAENARLTDENRALREAASLWIRLYEKQLDRANHATSARAVNERHPL